MDQAPLSLPHPDALQELERDLANLCEALNAHCAFVADEAGQIVSSSAQGERPEVPVLGALAVANLSATQQIVHLVDCQERNEPQMLIIEMPNGGGVILCKAVNNLSLVIMLKKESSLGLARLMAQEMTRQLGKLALDTEIASAGQAEELDLAGDLLSQLDQLWG